MQNGMSYHSLRELPSGPEAGASVKPAASESAPCLDLEDALERVGGDEQLLAELFQIFRSDAPGWLSQVRDGVRLADAQLLRRAAHTIKGAASSLGAQQTRFAAARLEELGRKVHLTGAETALAELEQALARLETAMSCFMPRP